MPDQKSVDLPTPPSRKSRPVAPIRMSFPAPPDDAVIPTPAVDLVLWRRSWRRSFPFVPMMLSASAGMLNKNVTMNTTTVTTVQDFAHLNTR